jgi:hypothetical protein
MHRRDRDRSVTALLDLLNSIDLTRLDADDLEEPQDDEIILHDLEMTDIEKKIFHAIKLLWKTFHLAQDGFDDRSVAMDKLKNSCVSPLIQVLSLLERETLQLKIESIQMHDEILELSVALDTYLQKRLPPNHGKDVFIRKGYTITLKEKSRPTK